MRLLWAAVLTVIATATLFAQQAEVEVGFSIWGLDGNSNKFRQYATPARSLFLRSLRYSPPFRFRDSDAGQIILKGIGEDDYRLEGGLDLWFGRTRAEFNATRNRFYDPTPFLVKESKREIEEGTVKYLLTDEFALSLSYRMDRQDRIFESPKLPYYQRTRYWDAVAEGKIGDSRLSLSYADWRYFDRTDIRPDTFVKRWNLRYLWEPNARFGIEGDFLRFSVKQPGRPNSNIETLALNADWTISALTDLSILLRRDKLDLPVVQNAWVRERRIGVANLTHRWRDWNLNIGFRQQESERLRGDQTFVDTPRWRTFEVRLSGRVLPKWRLTLRGWSQHLTHPPTMVTTDPRQLFWDDRRLAQLRLEGGSPTLNGYLALTHRRSDNDIRAIELTSNTLVVGGSWQASKRLNLFGEYAYESWRAKSEMTQFPTLDNFVPNSRVTTVGLSWAVDKRTFLSAAFTEFVTHNDNPLLLRDGNYRGRFWTANLRYRFPAGYEIALTVAPWRYRDRVVDLMDYDATIVMISGRARF